MSWSVEGLAPKEARSPDGRVLLVTGADHWFREGPRQPDRGEYWICGAAGCGRHRSEHVQARGQWVEAAHGFTAQRIAPSRCERCGHHRLHSRHGTWRWKQYEGGERRGGLAGVRPGEGLNGPGGGLVPSQRVGWPGELPVSWLGPYTRAWRGGGWLGVRPLEEWPATMLPYE